MSCRGNLMNPNNVNNNKKKINREQKRRVKKTFMFAMPINQNGFLSEKLTFFTLSLSLPYDAASLKSLWFDEIQSKSKKKKLNSERDNPIIIKMMRSIQKHTYTHKIIMMNL